MSHLLTDGRMCARPDGHNGKCYSLAAMERRRADSRARNRQRALQPRPCGLAGCDEPARKLPSGKYDALCVGHDREKARHWKDANPERLQVKEKDRATRERDAVFGHYGRECACCGSTDRLNIDHITGGGDAHRVQLGIKGGSPMYRWLIKNGFPEGYQTLCFPCNRSKHSGEHCQLKHEEAA